MAAKQFCIWTFRVVETFLFFLTCSFNFRFACDLFWAIVYSPYGIARFMEHGAPSLTATCFGMAGGILSVFNLWLFVYYDLEYYQFAKRLIEKFWHFSPAIEVDHTGWHWKLPYVCVLCVCTWDVWLGLATAKFFRLHKWVILAICCSVTITKCMVSGGALAWIRHLDPVRGKNAHLITAVLFGAFLAISGARIIWKKVRSWKRKPGQLISPA